MFRALADEAVNVDMIVQNVSTDGHTDISFTVPARGPRPARCKVMEQVVDEVEASGFTHDAAIGRVSLVGAGMKTHPGVAAQMFETLADEGVNIEMISHVVDPHLVRGAGGRRRAGRAGAARRVRARRAGERWHATWG